MRKFIVLISLLFAGCQPPAGVNASRVTVRGMLVDIKTVEHESWKYIVVYGENGRMHVLLHPNSEADLADMIRERAAKANLTVECDACRAAIQQANN